MLHMSNASLPRFTWVPFYEELAGRLIQYRGAEGQQKLITFLEQLRAAGHTITPLEDKDATGKRVLLREIDPFTFFGTFNRHISEDKRVGILERVRSHFGVKAEAPRDFLGVPVLNNMKSWFFGYLAKRTPEDVGRLWEVFVRALGDDPLADPAFGSAFDRALEVWSTNVNLTIGLFWIRPRRFLSLDNTMRAHLGLKLPKEGLSFAFYRDAVGKVQNKHTAPFYQLSLAAWEKVATGITKSEGALAADMEYWLVGAYWDSAEQPDQTERFLAEGLWENGYDDKYLDLVRQIKAGDRIAIKASGTQQNGLPFDNRGKTVSRLIIKARGVVVRNRGDGRTVEVEWEPRAAPRDWYFYTARATVWHIRKDYDLAQRLIRFTFFDELQDHAFFAARWWGASPPSLPVLPDENEDVERAEPYSVADMLAEGVFMRETDVALALRRLTHKKALILQGAPGVGKTFMARKLAYAFLEARDDARITSIQLHPSYTYEDFVRGYRPTGQAGTFALMDGPFLRLCQQAADDPDRRHVLLVDEINRGHLSQVFGELFMLLEGDKRGPRHAVTPLYRRTDGETFHVPENVYVIGTMNIADRSLALVDFALRRRFAFLTLEPQFGAQAFVTWLQERKMPPALCALIVQRMGALNNHIAEDSRLGPAFRVGHSFFCPRGEDFSLLTKDWFAEVVETEVVPLLEEYWHDAPQDLEQAVARLRA
jgi:5-methylcytosine-specific restriction enzyme B